MSYEKQNQWCSEVKEGIDSVVKDKFNLVYFYLNTKINPTDGDKRAESAYALFLEINPVGVITVDDNAQTLFTLPYLNGKTKIPVMFCGVNAEPDSFGFQFSHISGILERNHIHESIAFVKQLVPTIKRVGFMARDSASGRAIKKQVSGEYKNYVATYQDFDLVNTMSEAKATINRFKSSCDLLFMAAMNGILDETGKPVDVKIITRELSLAFGKPTIGANSIHVKYGNLCAVVKTGQEQGSTAAQMLHNAINGTPIQEIPITQNYKGKRMINVTVMNELKIKPKPITLVGAQMVRLSK